MHKGRSWEARSRQEDTEVVSAMPMICRWGDFLTVHFLYIQCATIRHVHSVIKEYDWGNSAMTTRPNGRLVSNSEQWKKFITDNQEQGLFYTLIILDTLTDFRFFKFPISPASFSMPRYFRGHIFAFKFLRMNHILSLLSVVIWPQHAVRDQRATRWVPVAFVCLELHVPHGSAVRKETSRLFREIRKRCSRCPEASLGTILSDCLWSENSAKACDLGDDQENGTAILSDGNQRNGCCRDWSF
jgi:hypothetical protein